MGGLIAFSFVLLLLSFVALVFAAYGRIWLALALAALLALGFGFMLCSMIAIMDTRLQQLEAKIAALTAGQGQETEAKTETKEA